MAEKILVTGATGKVGEELVRLLVAAGREVKAATRSPERARARFGAMVEVVELDYQRTETYDAAAMWADRIFLAAPPFDPRADEALVPFLDWAVASGTQHIVLLSAMGIESLEELALRKVEHRIESVGVGYTFLRPNWYMQNFSTGFLAEQIRTDSAFRLSAGEGRVSFVDCRDIAAVAAATLTGSAHYGKSYTLTGPAALSHDQAAAVLSGATGRAIRYEPISDDAMAESLAGLGWPSDQAEVIVALLRSMREGERAAVSPAAASMLGREPIAMEQFARDFGDVWR